MDLALSIWIQSKLGSTKLTTLPSHGSMVVTISSRFTLRLHPCACSKKRELVVGPSCQNSSSTCLQSLFRSWEQCLTARLDSYSGSIKRYSRDGGVMATWIPYAKLSSALLTRFTSRVARRVCQCVKSWRPGSWQL